jgi:predicted RNA-binding protein with PIN domain
MIDFTKNIDNLLIIKVSVKELIETFADYERILKVDTLIGFKELLNRYFILWNFDKEYNELIGRYYTVIEPTAIDWFENDFIQNTIKQVYKDELDTADEYINQINDLLTVNPNITWCLTE